MNLSISRKMLYKVIAGILLIAVTFIVYSIRQSGEDVIWIDEGEARTNYQNPQEEIIAEDEPMVASFIVIDVSGEVMVPSVYTLSDGARVYEAVDAAGGLTENADTRNTNLAAILSDGMKLYIPSKKEVEEEEKQTGETPGSRYINGSTSQSAAASGGSKAGLININTANSAELQKLPGVGPVTADKIISYRNEYGEFKAIEELMNVSGIGEKTFAKLKNTITAE
ncbi:MAG: hypothetical protein GXX92_01920 [Clostridiales bacterium]|nr:hypothetical protein [Clostridiales bacterium]